MELDALLLSRIQFAFTIGYHIIFPSLSIGLAFFLAILEGLELNAKSPERKQTYRRAYDFWLRFFALSFGMGVVSGVVLSYEIGTNWGRFSEIAGPVVGPLMSFEVLSAFFLEAGFLGIMLLGRNRVGPKVHYFSTCMVSLGTMISAFWILSANSFMHTPAGFDIVDGIVMPVDWWAIVFNPSFPYRYFHMVVAALLSTSFVIAAVGAWYVIHNRQVDFGKDLMKTGLLAAAVLAPTQVVIGDLHGLNTLEHQPIKVAAMEGHWETGGEVPLLLFAWPDEEAEENYFEIGIPKLASLILTHDPSGELQGLTSVPAEDRPPVAPVFFSFRLMVGLGMLMLGLAWLGMFKWWRGTLGNNDWFATAIRFCSPIGFFAILAGWVVTEVGRQPWTVTGLLRTSGASSLVPGQDVAFTLLAFVVVYSVLFVAFVLFFRHLLRKGPGSLTTESLPHQGNARPAFLAGRD